MNEAIFKDLKKEVNSKEFKSTLLILALMGLLSFIIMVMTFKYSTAPLEIRMFKSYFDSKWLMLMNIIPIFFIIALLSLIFNKLWISFSITSLLFFLMSVINNYKIIYRDEPVTFTDIKLITESMNMAKKYKISLTGDMLMILIGILLITFLIKYFVPYKILSKKVRVSLITILIIISGIIFKTFYFNPEIYNRVGNKDLINIWSQTQQFQSKGLVYPFTYSISQSKDRVLESYDEEKAKQLLDDKSYSNISEDKKVNVIAIMLESYNDFSKFSNVDLHDSVYENYYNIVDNSYSGNLITNVFGGGTINTEWSFLTGYNSHPNYVKDTNSFMRYFKEQGYKVEAMHPNFGWFYNRRNVNDYIGFDQFDYYENKYKAIQEEPLMDWEFFDYIIKGYEESKEEDKPYINFSVTYQNHGPYSVEKLTDTEYLKNRSNYDEKTYNIINNYLSGIKQTDRALKKLIDYFQNEDEPTIVVFFGDHNPWLGDDQSGYKMLDIDLDLSTTEGFLNYYETPYVIWGNQSAKNVLDKDFKGQGSDISPNFLMAELFQYVGWEGNEYMSYLFDVKSQFTVNHDMYFNDNGKYVPKLTDDKLQVWKDFNSVQYYYSRNFKKTETQD